MKKQPTPPPPMGPPNYRGPSGAINETTNAMVAKLDAIRKAMKDNDNAKRQ